MASSPMETTESLSARATRIDDLQQRLQSFRFVDLSPAIENGIPRWTTHPPLVVNQTVNFQHDDYYCQTIFMAEHTGVHVDAPAHTVAAMSDHTVDTIAVETLFAPAAVFDLRTYGIGPGELATAAMLEELDQHADVPLTAGDIALLNFGWHERYWSTGKEWRFYSENSPGLAEDAVAWLAGRRPVAVGSDTVSVDIALRDGIRTDPISYAHDVLLLPKSIYLIECLANLGTLPPRCFFIAIPLKIKGGSGSPIRAVALV